MEATRLEVEQLKKDNMYLHQSINNMLPSFQAKEQQMQHECQIKMNQFQQHLEQQAHEIISNQQNEINQLKGQVQQLQAKNVYPSASSPFVDGRGYFTFSPSSSSFYFNLFGLPLASSGNVGGMFLFLLSFYLFIFHFYIFLTTINRILPRCIGRLVKKVHYSFYYCLCIILTLLPVFKNPL